MLTSMNPIKPMDRLRCSESQEKCCVVDGDAPPERFDHLSTLTDESVFEDTHPIVLRTNGFDLSTSRSQIAVLVRHRSARLPSPQRLSSHIMSRKERDCRTIGDDFSTFTNSVRDRIWDCCTTRLSHQFTTFRVRIPVSLTQLASASISARSGMQMQPVPG